jgi:hypothetical protein
MHGGHQALRDKFVSADPRPRQHDEHHAHIARHGRW